MKPTLWVFGFGQFMKFFTPYLYPYFDIKIYDRENWSNNERNTCLRSLKVMGANIEETAKCDYVLLWYPAWSIANLVQKIAPHVTKDSVVFDVCSVKTPAVNAMLESLPSNCHIIATHPIFWPQSWKDGIKWLKCVFSNIRSSQEKYDFLKNIFWECLGLEIPEMTAEEHDREMAYIQWITHFIGRSLNKIEIPDSELATTSYQHLREASEMVGYDSNELFLSIQQDNPYAWEVRERLLKEFQNQQIFIAKSSL